MKNTQNTLYDMGKLVEKVDNIEKTVNEIVRKLDTNYLQKVEFDAKFEPVQKIVYGLIMAVLTSLVGVVILFLTRK